jgi:hypothetical protein
LCQEFDRSAIHAVVCVFGEQSLDRQMRSAAKKPGKEYENESIENSTQKCFWIGQGSVFDLFQNIHRDFIQSNPGGGPTNYLRWPFLI